MNGRPPRHVDSQNPHASMGFHESAMTCELLNHIFTILSIASLVFSALPNAVRRKYPSPLGPKPDPGVPYDIKQSQAGNQRTASLSCPSGVFNQMYGAFTPPDTL